jgi:hypothetical protein
MNTEPYKTAPHDTPIAERSFEKWTARIAAPMHRPSEDTAYDKNWAYVLSVISGWVYADAQTLADKLEFYLDDCEVYPISVNNDALCIAATAYVIVVRDVAILAFRGTKPEDLISWLTDANSAMFEFGKANGKSLGNVHSGFYANLQAVWSGIVDRLTPLLGAEARVKNLYITGHSLGAAMAVLAAAEIWKEPEGRYKSWREALRGVYSYAQPYVGDDTFKKTFDARFGQLLYRHVYDHDVVPCLPPQEVDGSFEQFGDRYFSETFEGEWRKQGPNEDKRARLLSLLSVLFSLVARRIDALKPLDSRLCPYSIDDHSPQNYIEVSRNSVEDRRASRIQAPLKEVGKIEDLLKTVEGLPQHVISTALSFLNGGAHDLRL